MSRSSPWDRKPCGCVKTRLSVGKVIIRCDRHRGKKSKKRLVCHFQGGMVRRG